MAPRAAKRRSCTHTTYIVQNFVGPFLAAVHSSNLILRLLATRPARATRAKSTEPEESEDEDLTMVEIQADDGCVTIGAETASEPPLLTPLKTKGTPELVPE